jgi:hypothetical protein
MRLPVVVLPSTLPDIAQGNVLPLSGPSFARPIQIGAFCCATMQ